MKGFRISKSLGVGDIAMMEAAFGAVAVRAAAIGALAIWRLAIDGVRVGRAGLKSLQIKDLVVTRLHAGEPTVSGPLELPRSDVEHQIS